MTDETPQTENNAAGGQSRAEGANLTAVLGADCALQRKKFLGFMVVTGLSSTRSDEIEFWQGGQIIGRIVGLAPNVI